MLRVPVRVSLEEPTVNDPRSEATTVSEVDVGAVLSVRFEAETVTFGSAVVNVNWVPAWLSAAVNPQPPALMVDSRFARVSVELGSPRIMLWLSPSDPTTVSVPLSI
jgi:hypothetical protein